MKVNIIYPKDGWYLQHTAEELIKRLDAEHRAIFSFRAALKRTACALLRKPCTDIASFEVSSGSDKTVNYYINYHLFKRKTPDIDVGHFTHPEPDGEFDNVARQVDFAVCMSERYAAYLREKGITHCRQIMPGLDGFFRPKLVLGWFGRFSYYGDRKGKGLFDKVRELDFVDLRQYADLQREQLAEAYRECDYVLITSKYEGGPMSLLEGIGCGKKIICPPDVGLAAEFPEAVIPYENSDWDSLHKALKSLYGEKERTASLVSGYTWDRFYQEHMRLFRELAG